MLVIMLNGDCTGGKGSEKSRFTDNTTWCCNGSKCEMTGKDIACKNGTPLPLTTPCRGKCNTSKSKIHHCRHGKS